MNKIFKIALCQSKCTVDKFQTLKSVESQLIEAAKNGSKLCFLGQIFNSPYSKNYMIDNAQHFDKSQTLQLLRKIAIQNGIYIFGSIPEKQQSSNKIFNSAFAMNKQGNIIAKMRKIHLFDIDIPGKIKNKQSQTFDSGNKICLFDTQYCKIGMAICYDVRFPELALLMAKKGAHLLYYPSSFTTITGPLHFQLLLRARAVDCQVYCAGVSCARYTQKPQFYQAYGGSELVNPFGKVLVRAQQKPQILYGEVNLEYLEQVRRSIPVWSHRRNDIYQVIQKQLKKLA